MDERGMPREGDSPNREMDVARVGDKALRKRQASWKQPLAEAATKSGPLANCTAQSKREKKEREKKRERGKEKEKESVSILAQVAVGNPRRLEPRWNLIRLNQLLSLLGRNAGGPTCPYLRRGRCLFFHPGDEAASASLVGRDQPPDGSVLARLARLERVVEQILAISVPQITKDTATMPQHAPAERVQPSALEQVGDGVQAAPQERSQPGDRACRDPVAPLHRQVCRRAGGDAATGPLLFRQWRRRWKSRPSRSSAELWKCQ